MPLFLLIFCFLRSFSAASRLLEIAAGSAATRSAFRGARLLPGMAVLPGMVLLLACLLPASSGVRADELRTWKDASGKFTIEAKLKQIDKEYVVLIKRDGGEIKVPISKLSTVDKRYLETQRPPSDAAPVLEHPVTIKAKVGVELVARDGPCANIFCYFPLPQSWPEQQVKVVNKELSKHASRYSVQKLDGVDMAKFFVKRMRQGETASVTVQLEVQRRQVSPPKAPQLLRIPAEVKGDLGGYLKASPFIEIGNAKVKQAAEQLVLDPQQPAWDQLRAIYDYTRKKVKFTGVRELKGALKGIETGGGDCEERTSVFVAICRLKGIPARCVWIPGHTYPEFYLVDERGKGHWFPCESVADHFGYAANSFLITQKGDRFRVPGHPKPKRYVTETITGNLGRGGAAPLLRPVREFEIVHDSEILGNSGRPSR